MRYGFGIVWTNQGVGDPESFLNEFKLRLEDCMAQEWQSNIHNSPKLSVYCTFKSRLEPESYLINVNIWRNRTVLAKCRCSSHKLAIETGRYDGTRMENRICLLCDKQGKTY